VVFIVLLSRVSAVRGLLIVCYERMFAS
jgi:hypothetical protein